MTLTELSRAMIAPLLIAVTALAPEALAQAPPSAATGMTWSGSFTTHIDPGFHLSDALPNSVDARFDAGLRLIETSQYVDFNTYIRLKRNEADSFIPGNPASFVGPAGLYAGAAFVTVKPTDWLSVYGGKFHGKFGAAWLLQPGFMDWFAEDYEQTERVGFGMEVKLPPVPVLGAMRITVDNFYADNSSFLSGTRALTFNYNSGPPYLRIPQNYGPASTGRLDSYTVALRGGSLQDGLYWQLSQTQESTGYVAGSTEHGIAATVAYGTQIIDDQTYLRGYAELAQLSNYDTVSGLTYVGLNTGISLSHGPWTFDVFGDIRRVRGTYHAHDSAIGWDVVRDLSETILPGVKVGAGVEHMLVGRFETWALYPYAEYSITF